MNEEQFEIREDDERDFFYYLNIILTIVLIIAISFAVNQRFLEDQKCVEWSKERVFKIRTGVQDNEYSCELNCSYDPNGYAEDSLSANQIRIVTP